MVRLIGISALNHILRNTEDVCELNILQMVKKTLTIQKPCPYLLLTKIISFKINKIDLIFAGAILVFRCLCLAELHLQQGWVGMLGLGKQ